MAIYRIEPFSAMVIPLRFGIYRLHEAIDSETIRTVEKEYNRSIEIVSVYRAWNRCIIEDDLKWLERLKHSPVDLLLTWEPWRIEKNSDINIEQPEFSLQAIAGGRHDAYIQAFARALASFQGTVYLRPMHEMNGNWYPWGHTTNGNNAESFIAAWRHIRKLVIQQGAVKVKWVWSPYACFYPPEPISGLERYFPGDNAVDWVALDGYNWGAALKRSGWQGFEEVFSDAYETVSALSRRPLMIAETACSELGGSKARWIIQALNSLKTRFQRVKILIWFDINKECDWRIASSPSSLRAFRLAGSACLPDL